MCVTYILPKTHMPNLAYFGIRWSNHEKCERSHGGLNKLKRISRILQFGHQVDWQRNVINYGGICRP